MDRNCLSMGWLCLAYCRCISPSCVADCRWQLSPEIAKQEPDTREAAVRMQDGRRTKQPRSHRHQGRAASYTKPSLRLALNGQPTLFFAVRVHVGQSECWRGEISLLCLYDWSFSANPVRGSGKVEGASAGRKGPALTNRSPFLGLTLAFAVVFGQQWPSLSSSPPPTS